MTANKFQLKFQIKNTMPHHHDTKNNSSKKVPRVFSVNPVLYFTKEKGQSAWFIICFKIDAVGMY